MMKAGGRKDTPLEGAGHAAAGLLLGVSLVLLAGGLAGCSGQQRAAKVAARGDSAADANRVPAVLATIGTDSVTMTEIRARIGVQLDGLDTNYQQARHKLIEGALDEILRERVLGAAARKQGKTVDAIVAAEAGGPLDPTAVEVSAWYEANKARLAGRTLEQLRPQIAAYLRQQRQAEAQRKLMARLEREDRVTVDLQPYRIQFHDEAAPSRGAASAPVTLVEFADFQCPYCGQLYPVMRKIEKDFGDTVRVVYRQDPIPSLHPYAEKAAEASLCAKEQGQFWQMHDLLFQEQDRLEVKDLKEKAGRLGLDTTRFNACLDSGKYVEQIQADQQDAARAGVNGTPALFVNGIPVEGGAVPYDVVAAAIREELARNKH